MTYNVFGGTLNPTILLLYVYSVWKWYYYARNLYGEGAGIIK